MSKYLEPLKDFKDSDYKLQLDLNCDFFFFCPLLALKTYLAPLDFNFHIYLSLLQELHKDIRS